MTSAWISPEGCAWVPHNRWDLLSATNHTRKYSVAVVVPYFNQPASLQRLYRCLDDLNANLVEVVIADDGSHTPPPSPPKGFPLRVSMLSQEDRGCRPGAARNLAVAATEAEIIVCLDADTLPAPGTVMRLAGWPARLADALVVGNRHHADLAGWSPDATTAWLRGNGPPPPIRSDPHWLTEGWRNSKNLLHSDGRSYRYVISAVMAFGRQLWEDLGGFDPNRDEYGGEDWELAYRAYNNGAVLVQDPQAVAWHDEPDWTERGGGNKTPETLWLAAAIPEPLTRGRGIIHPDPDVLIDLDADGDDAALVLTVQSMLTAFPDARLRLARSPGRHASAFLAHDPRIQHEPHTERQHRRARAHLSCGELLVVDSNAMRTAFEQAIADDIGELHIAAKGETVLRVQTSRASGRSRRCPPQLHDPIGTLFGRRRLDLLDVGGHLLHPGVELATALQTLTSSRIR